MSNSMDVGGGVTSLSTWLWYLISGCREERKSSGHNILTHKSVPVLHNLTPQLLSSPALLIHRWTAVPMAHKQIEYRMHIIVECREFLSYLNNTSDRQKP